MKRFSDTNPQAGSAIVGVLVGILFISAVTMFMVKNTGYQSLSSRSWAAIQTAQLSVSSGIIATESFFAREGNIAALHMLDSVLADEQYMPYIHGGSKEKDKVEIAGGQRFSSQLINFSGENMMAWFDVNSGRNLKGAHAFFKMENIYIETNYGAKNAIYMRGALGTGDNGMEVHGNAMFEGNAQFQNQPGIFHGETFFSEDVHIMHGATKFSGKTYIGGNATFQNFSSSHTIFESDAGINGYFNTEGNSNPVRVGGNLYINGNFGNQWSLGTNINFQSTGTNKTFYHTDKLALHNSDVCPSSDDCSLHTRGHIDSNNIKDFANKTSRDSMKIPELLDMGDAQSRRDPQIDISKIPSHNIKSAFNEVTLGSNFSVTKLHEAYKNASDSDHLYNGHLVLKIGKNDPIINFPPSDNGTFKDKVIFIIEDGATLNAGMRFYHSGDSSSTLIYAGAGNAQLQQFGSDGPFRGMVYIDSLNTAQNSFNFRPGASIEGAVHNFSNVEFVWNGGGKIVPIRFNENVLNAFASLKKGAPTNADKGKVVFANTEEQRVKMRVAGIYFR